MKSKQIIAALAVYMVTVLVILYVANNVSVAQDQSAASSRSTKVAAAESKTTRLTELERFRAKKQEFLRLVKIGEFDEAKNYSSKHSIQMGPPLGREIASIQRDKGSDPQVLFNVIDFLLKQAQRGWSSNPDRIVDEYQRLVKQLSIPDADAAFLESTKHLYDLRVVHYYPHNKGYENREAEWERAFTRCTSVLETRPDDTAARGGLQNIMSYGSQAQSTHFGQLKELCRTRDGKRWLAELAIKCKFQDEQLDEIVDTALPMLGNDSARASLLLDAGRVRISEDASRQSKIASRIVKEYPRTLAARSALANKISEVASDDVDGALRMLNSVADPMQLTKDETEYQKYRVCSGPFYARQGAGIRDSAIRIDPKFKQQKDKAKSLLDDLIASRTKQLRTGITLRVNIADSEGDHETMHRLGVIWMNELQDGYVPTHDRIATVFARSYASQKQWKLAHDAWGKWPASNGGCGTWSVFPTEIRVVNRAICQLYLREPNKAVELISTGMTDRDVQSRVILPLLLFHVYRRADQLDDFWTIAAQWNADAKLIKRGGGGVGGSGLTIDQLQARQSSFAELQKFANDQNWNALIEICRRESSSSDSYHGSMLGTTEAAQASVHLSESGAKGASAIKAFYQGLDEETAPETQNHDWWIIRSLQENPSNDAKEFLAELKPEFTDVMRFSRSRRKANLSPIQRLAMQADRAGVFRYRDNVPGKRRHEQQMESLRMYFDWPAPPAGSLPKQLPLVWRE